MGVVYRATRDGVDVAVDCWRRQTMPSWQMQVTLPRPYQNHQHLSVLAPPFSGAIRLAGLHGTTK